MSAGDDNIFSRWSRRKLARKDEEAPPPGEEQTAAPEAAADAAPDDQPPQEESDPAEPLPSLEDLTAQSDLSAFLRKGVPDALKSAALRKMWSLDPAIRDYIGPSEYAWDFNQPGSMPGFGTLEPNEAVVEFLSKTVRTMEPVAEPTAATEPPDAFPERPATVPPDTVTDVNTPEPSQAPEPLEPNPPLDVADSTEAAPDDAEPAKPSHPADEAGRSQVTEPVVRPRHGSAIPR